jgi:hypothetical protein
MLPDAEMEVLVQLQRTLVVQTEVALAVYDDSNDACPWSVAGALLTFGCVLFWAEVPHGPELKKVQT